MWPNSAIASRSWRGPAQRLRLSASFGELNEMSRAFSSAPDARILDLIQRLMPARYWTLLARIFKGLSGDLV